MITNMDVLIVGWQQAVETIIASDILQSLSYCYNLLLVETANRCQTMQTCLGHALEKLQCSYKIVFPAITAAQQVIKIQNYAL